VARAEEEGAGRSAEEGGDVMSARLTDLTDEDLQRLLNSKGFSTSEIDEIYGELARRAPARRQREQEDHRRRMELRLKEEEQKKQGEDRRRQTINAAAAKFRKLDDAGANE
jgi:DNA-binding transcriptional MerR regulator